MNLIQQLNDPQLNEWMKLSPSDFTTELCAEIAVYLFETVRPKHLDNQEILDLISECLNELSLISNQLVKQGEQQ